VIRPDVFQCQTYSVGRPVVDVWEDLLDIERTVSLSGMINLISTYTATKDYELLHERIKDGQVSPCLGERHDNLLVYFT
jgi:hypothetical protein